MTETKFIDEIVRLERMEKRLFFRGVFALTILCAVWLVIGLVINKFQDKSKNERPAYLSISQGQAESDYLEVTNEQR